MPLSPHEEEQLRQIEQHLYEDKALVRAATDPFGQRGRLALGVVAVLGGLAVLVFGVSVPIPLASIMTGVVGFAIAWVGAVVAVTAWRRSKGVPTDTMPPVA